MDRRRIAPKPEMTISEAWSCPTKVSPPPSNAASNKVSYIKCECCPYGYHIDVDFVRYCEALSNEKYVRQLRQLHRNRRKQRKSMEILLGNRYEGNHHELGACGNEEASCSAGALPQFVVSEEDPLQDAMKDFEEAYRVSTLERKHKNSLHPMDLLNTSVSGLSMSMSSSSDSDTCLLLNGDELNPADRYRSDSISSLSTISNCTDHHHHMLAPPPSSHMANTLATFDSHTPDSSVMAGQISPTVLQSIREQMAVSLQRMKELEEQAKAVPVLQVKLSVLKEEKRLLMMQLKVKDKPPPRKVRSTGVNCAALTRDVSVNCTPVFTKSVAVDAAPLPACQVCHKKSKTNLSVEIVGLESIESHPCSSCTERNSKVLKSTASITESDTVSKGTSTYPIYQSTLGVQAVPFLEVAQSQTMPLTPPKKPETRDNWVMAERATQRHVSCSYKPDVVDRAVGERLVLEEKTRPEVRTMGVGCGRVDSQLLCDGCTNRKFRTISTDTNHLVERRSVGCEIKERVSSVCDQCSRDDTDTVSDITHTSLDILRERESSNSDSSETSDDESSSPDEASYDGLRGTIVHSCGDDEAIRQGRPGAVMFLPRPILELKDSMKEAFIRLDKQLEKEGRLPTDNSSDDMKIVKEEWFKASSQKDSQGTLVEDWLDAMEAVSPSFLAAVVNLPDSSGNTALHYAISHSNFDVVSLLLDSKVCDINHCNKAGYNCIMLSSLVTARENSHLSVLKQLFKLGDVNAKAAEHGQTALMLAASHGKLDMVRVLYDAGADINIQDKDGSTALMCASEHGHLAVVRYLLAQVDCQPNLVDNDGCNALSIAVEAGHKDIGLLIYAHTSFSRGSSPSSSLRLKNSSRPVSSPSSPLPTPPYSPSKSRKSTSSIP